MSNLDGERVLDFFDKMMSRASEERREQTQEFTKAIDKQTGVIQTGQAQVIALVRMFGIALLLVLAGVSGLNIYFKNGDSSFDMRGNTSVSTAPAPPSH